MWFEREGKVVISLPGVPFEMEALKAQAVAAYTFACYRAARRTELPYDVTADSQIVTNEGKLISGTVTDRNGILLAKAENSAQNAQHQQNDMTGGNIIPGFTWGIAAVNNMAVSFACYYIGGKIVKK